MSLDDRISRGLASIADRVEPDAHAALPGVDRKRRRIVIARVASSTAVAGLALAVALVAVPAALDNRQEPPPFGTGSPTAGPAALPETFVVATTNAVKVFSTSTGREIRTLFESNEYRVRGIALSADRSTVFFGRERLPIGDLEVEVDIVAVPTAGGALTHIADGHSPALSSAELVEGAWRGKDLLAYVGPGSEAQTSDGELRCYSKEPIVIRDTVRPPFEPSDEYRWPWALGDNDPSDPYTVCSGPNALARSLNDKVAYERNVGDPLYQVWVLDVCCDPKTARDIVADANLVQTDRSVRAPAFLPNGDLLVVEDIDIHGADPHSAVWLIDGDTLKPIEQLFASERIIGSVSYDITGEHLIVAEQGGCGAGCLRISRWDGTTLGEIAQIDLSPDDYAKAAW